MAADVEKQSLGEVDKSTSNTVGAALDKGSSYSHGKSRVDGLIEPVLEGALETHSADTPNIGDGLWRKSSV